MARWAASPVMPTKVGIHDYWCGTQERRGWRAFARHDGMGVVRATPDAVIVGRRLSYCGPEMSASFRSRIITRLLWFHPFAGSNSCVREIKTAHGVLCYRPSETSPVPATQTKSLAPGLQSRGLFCRGAEQRRRHEDRDRARRRAAGIAVDDMININRRNLARGNGRCRTGDAYGPPMSSSRIDCAILRH